jgi:hypothetical protein
MDDWREGWKKKTMVQRFAEPMQWAIKHGDSSFHVFLLHRRFDVTELISVA